MALRGGGETCACGMRVHATAPVLHAPVMRRDPCCSGLPLRDVDDVSETLHRRCFVT